jgi:hypothetical protein
MQAMACVKYFDGTINQSSQPLDFQGLWLPTMNSIPALWSASVCSSRSAASSAMVSRSQRIDVDSSKTEVRSNALDKFGHLVILRIDLVTRLGKKVFHNFNVAPVVGIG